MVVLKFLSLEQAKNPRMILRVMMQDFSPRSQTAGVFSLFIGKDQTLPQCSPRLRFLNLFGNFPEYNFSSATDNKLCQCWTSMNMSIINQVQ